MDIVPLDLIERLAFRGYIRFQKNEGNYEPEWVICEPQIKILGKEGQFCSLIFDFGSDVLCYSIFIKDLISLNKILNVASVAIKNFVNLSKQ